MPEAKTVTTASGEVFGYDKLVIATGSRPYKAKWLAGNEKENVFVIPKDKVYLDEMAGKLASCKNVVVIGAGFIGVEFSDELNKKGFHVTLGKSFPISSASLLTRRSPPGSRE